MGKHTLKLGDCREILTEIPEGSVDAVVCDPPYELGFMGKRWDASGIAYQVGVWAECLRVLKPGGHLLAFGGTRTYHRMTCAIEDAGFEIRDSIHWIYGSGFPKSLDVSKAIDKEAGVEREVVGTDKNFGRTKAADGKTTFGDYEGSWNITAPATPEAKKWDGWGTALKPAHEIIVVARKPLRGTVAANVKKHGTGGLNIDGCRVEGIPPSVPQRNNLRYCEGDGAGRSAEMSQGDKGRWPPNILLSHPPECNKECIEGCPVKELDMQSGEGQSSGVINRWTDGAKPFGGGAGHPYESVKGVADSGGASRFFPCFRYEAKASRSEREEGCEGLPRKSPGECTDRVDGSDGLNSPRAGAGRTAGAHNNHPTVKPIDLMRWLVRLVCPKDGTILDPFMGSGTTGIAAHKESCKFIGIEKDPDYFKIAEARIAEATKQGRLF